MADTTRAKRDLDGPPRRGSSASRTEVDHMEQRRNSDNTEVGPDHASHGKASMDRRAADSKMENPLAGLSAEELSRMGEDYCIQHNITDEEDIRAFRLGAIIAGNQNRFDTVDDLSEEERRILTEEDEHRWRNPKSLYFLIAICSLCAAVQGMGTFHC
jgi:hypothetical protein